MAPLEFNVTDFGAKGDGLHNDGPNIQAALDAAASRGGGVAAMPPGKYRIVAPLDVADFVQLVGAGPGTVIVPSAMTKRCIVVHGPSVLANFVIDGGETAGAKGISAGEDRLVSNSFVRAVTVRRFTGAGAAAIVLGQAVSFSLTDCYLVRNETNLATIGGPTDTLFLNCQFREATRAGVSITNGYSLNFLKCSFEANHESGVRIENVGDNAVDVRFSECWFEGNWLSQPAGRQRHENFHFVVEGTRAGTIRPSLRDCAFFPADDTGARAMKLTTAIDYLIDRVSVRNEPGQIVCDGKSYGTFANWHRQNGDHRTTVNDLAGGAVHVGAQASDEWTDWVPTFTGGGSMRLTDVKLGIARYKVVGKTMLYEIAFTATASGGNATIAVSLPAGMVAREGSTVENPCWITDGKRELGSVRVADRAILFIKPTNFTAGPDRGAQFAGQVELR
jgi:hypothetical protein